jgi:hypothetical protein
MRGRIHTVVSSTGGTRPTQRQSETMTWVAPIAGLRANAIGTGSLTPPSVSLSARPPLRTSTFGNRTGIDALARTASLKASLSSEPVAE